MSDESAPLDLEKLMRDMERSGREQRMIESHRPTAQQIGDMLAQVIPIARELFEAHRRLALLRREQNPDQDYGLQFADNSIAADDDLWVREHLSFEVPLNEIGEPIFYLAHPLVDPVRCVLDFVQRFVRAAMDHLEALGHLVRDDVGFRATAVLSRAALEACAAASYLMSAEVPPAERLRRLWNLQCEQLTESVRRDASAAPDAISGREDVLAAAESVGFDVKRVKPSYRYRTPCVLAEDGKPHSSTGEMIESVLTADLGKSMWQGLSDIAHSKSSGLMLLDEISPRHRQIPAMRTESIAFHAMPALIAFAGLGDHLEEYLGWSDLSWNKTLERVLGLWNAASGGSDVAIRQHLGLPPR